MWAAAAEPVRAGPVEGRRLRPLAIHLEGIQRAKAREIQPEAAEQRDRRVAVVEKAAGKQNRLYVRVGEFVQAGEARAPVTRVNEAELELQAVVTPEGHLRTE
ncbi:MAG: hypothetical protein WDM96_17980 [Lacunisphaera sp.]